MRTAIHILLLLALTVCCSAAQKPNKKGAYQKTALDLYIEEALARSDQNAASARSGGIFAPSALMADLNRDLRALRVDDVVTILVVEQASSVTSGSVSTDRSSKARTGFDGLFGPIAADTLLTNLVGFQGSASMDGKGATSRQVAVTTTLSARVTHVLPNGNLALEGVKRIGINGEQQEVRVRGVIRPIDLGRANTVSSDRLAMLEVFVNGKGVVADAIRKPHFLINILTKILPF